MYRHKYRLIIPFLFPALALYIIFVVYPYGRSMYIAFTKSACGTQGIRVVAKSFVYNGDGFETTVRMVRKSWNGLPVIHAPLLGRVKITS